MQLGLFTPVFGKLSLDAMLVELKRYPQIRMLEIGTGGWPGTSHIDVDDLLANRHFAREYLEKLSDAGLSISALSCHGNPLHPQEYIAMRDDTTFRRTVRLAELLKVPVVITFSGCPGGSPKDSTPNWITAAGLPVPRGRVVPKDELAATDPLPLPYVVKPIGEGSSVGVEIIRHGDNRRALGHDREG